jgi:protein arginine kinase activator
MKIRRVIGKTKETVELSAQQAEDMGIVTSLGNPVTVAWLLDGMLAALPADSNAQCPVCGTTHRDVALYRTVGCAQCYHYFDRVVENLLHLPVEESPHRGRIPRRLLHYRSLFIDREQLRTRLDEALLEEDFETAASVRDELESL